MLWASIASKVTWLLLPAVLMTFSTLFYGIAAFKGEDVTVAKVYVLFAIIEETISLKIFFSPFLFLSLILDFY